MFFGAHCSTAGGAWKALERARDIGASVCQVFVKNNMQWFGRLPTPEEVQRFEAVRAEVRLQALFGHTGYLINIAAPKSPNRDKSIQSLIQEIEIADQLQIPFLVLHPGAHLGAGEEQGIKRAARALDQVFRATAGRQVRIALENTAGQGTCLGHQIQNLAELYQLVKHPERLGVCLDTAHFFAAGYDLRTPRGWRKAIKEVETLIGLDQILAFHLNDSKTGLGSRVDRHAGIGQGEIGKEAFRHIVRGRRFGKLPGCLETPKSADLHEDIENLAILRELAGKG